MLRHGSLESGIGGFDYAAEMMGWENVFHCEINPFCQTVLKYYWPNAKSYTDIFGMDGREWRGKVDLITCGFPCQPFSHAGKRKGDKDDRFIWPENLRIIREARPGIVVAENVPGLLTIGDGLVFERVCTDLENEGYEVSPFIIPACGVEAVHKRERVWIVAYHNHFHRGSGAGRQNRKEACNGFSYASHTNGHGSQNRVQKKRLYREDQGFRSEPNAGGESWIEAATRLCGVDDVTSGRLDFEAVFKGVKKSQRRKAYTRWRTESLKAYGNAIVWKVAYQIFQAIDLTLLLS